MDLSLLTTDEDLSDDEYEFVSPRTLSRWDTPPLALVSAELQAIRPLSTSFHVLKEMQ